MLKLIIGRSGSGKTASIYDRITALARNTNGRPLILLVPEQFSFESERILLERLGPQAANAVQVFSFTRLAETVFRETGGLAGRRIDDGTRILLMSQALQQVADQLTLYAGHINDADYLQALIAMETECKQCAVSTQMLEEATDGLAEGTLRQKIQELSLILSAYEALAANAYVDPLDDLSKLAASLPDSSLIRGSVVFVDSFKGFTMQEMNVLTGIMRSADQITIALCTDSIQDDAEGYGRFSSVIHTIGQLLHRARENNVPVAGIERLEHNYRSRTDALRFLEEGCFLPCPKVYYGEADSVSILPCPDVYTECSRIASHIRRNIRENKLRCRDVAVVVRDLSAYQGILDVAMEQEGLSYYMDARRDILSDPLVTLLLSALQASTGGWHTEDLLRMMKTGLLPFSVTTVSNVENYVFQWRINGSRWRQEWISNPAGLSAKEDEETTRQLSSLNRARQRLIQPLERLRDSLKSYVQGDDFAQAVYRYLLDAQADKLLQHRVKLLQKAKEHALADSMARMWDILMDVLDQFATVLQHTSMPVSRYVELLRLVISVTDMGTIPQTLDAVQIGSADRIRFASPRAVYILGANEGVFPAYPTSQGILGDKERLQLIELGISFTDMGDEQTAEERFLAYAALSAPSEQLVISYAESSVSGESLSPSILVETVRRILPGHKRVCADDPLTFLESEQDAFSLLAQSWKAPSPLTSTLQAYFMDLETYRRRLAALGRASDGLPFRFEDSRRAADFFGKEMRLSPSRVEKYHLCRFAYFCQYGLHARTRRPADLDGLEFGTLVHAVMEKLLPVYQRAGFDSITRTKVLRDTGDAVHAYVDEFMGGLEDKSHRFLYLLQRLTATCRSLLWQVVLELRQSRFVPTDFELPVGLPAEEGQASIPAMDITLADGTKLAVQGKIDRVDVFQKDGVSYIRVVDYKTGTKEFSLAEVVEGINLQMLIYLMSLWVNGRDRYGEVVPAGVLYLPAKLPVVRIDRHSSEEDMEKARVKTMRMNGLLLDNPEIIRAMETDAAGLFIPARLNAGDGGLAANSSVASLEQFGKLKKRMEKLLTDMAATLREGDIAPIPAKSKTVDACAFCEYRTVCGHEQDDAVRQLRETDTKELMKELDNEEPENERT